jgi:hypothetical protein
MAINNYIEPAEAETYPCPICGANPHTGSEYELYMHCPDLGDPEVDEDKEFAPEPIFNIFRSAGSESPNYWTFIKVADCRWLIRYNDHSKVLVRHRTVPGANGFEETTVSCESTRTQTTIEVTPEGQILWKRNGICNDLMHGIEEDCLLGIMRRTEKEFEERAAIRAAFVKPTQHGVPEFISGEDSRVMTSPEDM